MTATNYAGFTERDFSAMLTRGAERIGAAARAAVHLVLASGLELRPWVEENAIELVTTPGANGSAEISAFPANWARLTSHSFSTGSARKLMNIASALANGGSFSGLHNLTEGLAPWHARALAEAMLIATGVETWFEVTETGQCPAEAHPGLLVKLPPKNWR